MLSRLSSRSFRSNFLQKCFSTDLPSRSQQNDGGNLPTEAQNKNQQKM